MDEKYMKRAIELAKLGEGGVNPNPLVGALIVKDNQIIGEGFHKKYGQLHAERNAFLNCPHNTEGADLYVTLEPCCHHGKTPPCTDIIIEKKIKNVYIGSFDPNPVVSGKGAKILREHGINVVCGVLKEECDSINDVFFHYIKKKTPYVVMKYAMTADGKIATKTGHSRWITGESARNHVHILRNKYYGIMVGIQTVLCDNPMLNCRMENGRNPVRIICDSNLRIPTDSNIVKTANEIKTIVATISKDEQKINELKNLGVIVLNTKEDNKKVDLKHLMTLLGEQQIDSILLEGGACLNYSALKSGIVNKVLVYIAPKIFGGEHAKTPVGGEGIDFAYDGYKLGKPKINIIENDVLLEYSIIN